MHKNITTTQWNHNTRCNVVHPQFRGYVHRTMFYSTLYKNHSSDLRTQLQISSISQVAHLAADLLNHPKNICAHSCRGHPRTQLGLNLSYKTSLSFASNHLTSKA